LEAGAKAAADATSEARRTVFTMVAIYFVEITEDKTANRNAFEPEGYPS
jgi:hypothetical protein